MKGIVGEKSEKSLHLLTCLINVMPLRLVNKTWLISNRHRKVYSIWLYSCQVRGQIYYMTTCSRRHGYNIEVDYLSKETTLIHQGCPTRVRNLLGYVKWNPTFSEKTMTTSNELNNQWISITKLRTNCFYNRFSLLYNWSFLVYSVCGFEHWWRATKRQHRSRVQEEEVLKLPSPVLLLW